MASGGDDIKGETKLVCIPCDNDAPLAEWTIPYTEETEVPCVTTRLQEHFKHFKGGKPAAVPFQFAETVPLRSGSVDNGFMHTNMYCDDNGVAKDLPINARACAFAAACGRAIQVRGDAFVARFMDSEEEFQRHDMTLADVSSDAAWVKEAAVFNAQRPSGQAGGLDAMASSLGMTPGPGGVMTAGAANAGALTGGAPPAASSSGPGTDGEDKAEQGFSWQQDEEEVSLQVECPQATKAKDVTVSFAPSKLSVAVATLDAAATNVVKAATLFARVRPDECTWSVGNESGKRMLTVTLNKEKEENWPSLFADSS
eukprot:m.484510 g.484510  ORF g.484510 m.484510 type:complete len:313 (-) comp23389_c0_seq1:395-1333(-)